VLCHLACSTLDIFFSSSSSSSSFFHGLGPVASSCSETMSNYESYRLLGQGISPSHGHYNTNTKCRHISTPRVKCDPTLPVLERQKTFRALDRSARVIYRFRINLWLLWILVQRIDLSQRLRMQVQHKHGKSRTYQCFDWDSGPQPQYSSDQRQYLP
jgi:hypothetical protein